MEKTAKQLVQLTRQWIQNYNQIPWRDGFEADEEYAEGSGTILSMLNEAQRQLLETGYAKCVFRFQMEAGRREYSVDPWLHQFAEVTYKDRPMQRTTVGELDRVNPGWRTAPAGTPTKFYFLADQVGMVPAPVVSDPNDTTQYSLVIRADSMVSELAKETDVAKRLPARFHEVLAIGAAYFISVADTENEAALRRVGFLKSWWDKGKNELKEVTQQRDLDQFDQVPMLDYREQYRR